MQCQSIRDTEFAEVEEKLGELEKQMEEILKLYSPDSLLLNLESRFYSEGFIWVSLFFMAAVLGGI